MPQNLHLHIVAFDVPYPASYGGVIDIYFKIKALHDLGVKVHLHCYQYGREQSSQLKKICKTVNYYKRKTYKNPFYGKLPYIVSTRNSGELIQNLKKDNYPILFEGLHCSYYLSDPQLKSRVKILRAHNIEHDYYRKLEEVERNFFKKYFFRIESEKLFAHEHVLNSADVVAAISPNDHRYFKEKYGNSILLPAFHSNENVNIKKGKGGYILYHGNLGVGENNEAALFIVTRIFQGLDLPLIIAGSNPSPQLKKAVSGLANVSLMDKLSSEQILELIQNAQINLLPTFQATGIKLKLINALFLGRFCLANSMMVENTGLENLCEVAESPEEFREKILKLWNEGVDDRLILKRQEILGVNFNNIQNARNLVEEIKVLM